MAIDFPNAPAVGDIYTNLDRSWQWTGTQWISVVTAPQPPFSGRNAIVNGGFAIWQRDNAWFTVGANVWTMTADQWQVIHNSPGAGAVLVERLPAASNAVAGGRNGLRWRTGTYVAGASYSALINRIEGVDTFAGQVVTLSFSVSSSYAFTGNMLVHVRQIFGSGGSADVTVLAQQTVAVTDGQAQRRVTFTFTMPSIQGKTIGTGHHVIVQFDAPITMSFGIDLAAVKLELGAVATPYIEPLLADELLRCRRYLIPFGGPSYAIVGFGQLLTNTTGMILVPTPGMRATPVLQPTGVWYIADGATAWSIALASVNSNLSMPGVNTILDVNLNGSGVFPRPVYMYANNQTGVRIYLSAEL